MGPRTARRIRSTLLHAWLVVAVVVVCFPLYYVFEGALTPSDYLHEGLPGLVPVHLDLGNVERALQVAPLGRQFLNSVVVTLAQTTLQVVIGIVTAYALVFCRLRGTRAIFLVLLASMMIPGETTLIANYLTVASWHLIDTLLVVFLPFVASALTIFLFRQAFLSFPAELHEAAVLDGAGHVRFIRSMLLPVTRPTLVSVTLVSATAAWNGFFWPLLVTNSPENRTVQVGIAQLSNAEASDVGVVLAGAAMVTLPVLVLVLVAQRFLAGGITAGALK
ncbi:MULTISPECIES: carbohydrate ABC transporter permease [unclassified Curtobacterium]|uniref:carbohydrate ABC transporter permease n=1 Tax=unclassified Curtobacterium TaxID=257496 RepID=UPI0008DC6C8B|nr:MULTISPECIES: carbohydrate ABC transporter permease [unclassified Curtobacterium]WIA96249.1 carbohydrate ABC transporter permease [Curtobacterium sp. MCBA15_004]WIA99550.1 carbohydrate ABC transporter permease [Curtobacterium sp. MCBA15_012]